MKRPRLLLDSNILIDYLVKRLPFYEDARKLMVLGAVGEAELWLSSSQFNDVFYVLSQGGKGHLGLLAQDRLRQCRSFLRICDVTEEDIDKTLDMKWDDLEDASVAHCADKVGAQYIITRDADGFARSKVSAYTATEYFSFLEESQGITYHEVTRGLDT